MISSTKDILEFWMENFGFLAPFLKISMFKCKSNPIMKDMFYMDIMK